MSDNNNENMNQYKNVEPMTPVEPVSEPMAPVEPVSEPMAPVGPAPEPMAPVGPAPEPMAPVGPAPEPMAPVEPVSESMSSEGNSNKGKTVEIIFIVIIALAIVGVALYFLLGSSSNYKYVCTNETSMSGLHYDQKVSIASKKTSKGLEAYIETIIYKTDGSAFTSEEKATVEASVKEANEKAGIVGTIEFVDNKIIGKETDYYDTYNSAEEMRDDLVQSGFSCK